MHIKTKFHGILADWVGSPSASFELIQGSTLTDLMLEIGHRYRQNMPDQLWDQKINSFNQKVRAFKDAKALDPANKSLADGDVITFMVLIAGG